MRPWTILCAAFALTGCSLGERFLVPAETWLAEPSALGLEFEDVAIETGCGTSVHGWFLPSRESDGRTVVLFHGNAANITYYHPYYRFLHDAGFHVFLFDYRGYGKSRGDVSVAALFSDADAAIAHVMSRPEVDRTKVTLLGISLGAIVALRAAADHPELAGVAVENVSSPHALLRRHVGWFVTACAELVALPGGMEPADNAARHEGPALFLCGAWDPQLTEHLAAAAAHAGPTASWVMPDTGHAPAGMLRHDGEYQDALVQFLRDCAEGRPPRLRCEIGAGAVSVTRHDGGDGALPIEIAFVGGDGTATFERRWLEGDRGEYPLPTEGARFAAAWVYARTEGRPDEGTWEPRPGPLKHAADVLPILHDLAVRAASDDRPLVHARAFVAALGRHEREHGPFPALAAAELVPDLLVVGRALAAGDSAADTESARSVLRRAVAAEPADPRLHYWPASRYTAGFAHGVAVAEARELLAELDRAR